MRIRSRRARRTVGTIAVVIAALCLSSCGHATKSSASATPSFVSSPAGDAGVSGDPEVYAAAAKELQEYLDTWRRDGAAVAAEKYLVPDERPPPDSQYLPALKSGRVVSYRPYDWVSANHFTLLVRLDIELVDPEAASGGGDDFFVTFMRSDAQTPYLMYLATGP